MGRFDELAEVKEDSEKDLDKFRNLLLKVEDAFENKQEFIAIECSCASQARSLRRKLYRLRDKIPESSRVKALSSNTIFSLQGRRVVLKLQPDWTKSLVAIPNEIPGVPANENEDKRSDAVS